MIHIGKTTTIIYNKTTSDPHSQISMLLLIYYCRYCRHLPNKRQQQHPINQPMTLIHKLKMIMFFVAFYVRRPKGEYTSTGQTTTYNKAANDIHSQPQCVKGFLNVLRPKGGTFSHLNVLRPKRAIFVWTFFFTDPALFIPGKYICN